MANDTDVNEDFLIIIENINLLEESDLLVIIIKIILMEFLIFLMKASHAVSTVIKSEWCLDTLINSLKGDQNYYYLRENEIASVLKLFQKGLKNNFNFNININ